MDWGNSHKDAVTNHGRQGTFASGIPLVEHLNRTEAMNTVLIIVATVLIVQWFLPEMCKPVKGGRKLLAQQERSELRSEERRRITDVDLVFVATERLSLLHSLSVKFIIPCPRGV